MAIVLFTDFGCEGIYTGQMEAVIDTIAPDARIISLVNDAPATNPLLSSYLLAALSKNFPRGTVFVAVVDPGVGGERGGLVLEADGLFFVGPDNGLLNTIAAQSGRCRWFEISWQPEQCSNSFHGRDIFAPVAANLYRGQAGELLRPLANRILSDWPLDLFQIIYFDHFGNAMTGVRYHPSLNHRILSIKGCQIYQAKTFSAVNEGDLFWYKNSAGLIEVAANKANAEFKLDLVLGDKVRYR